MSDSWASEFTDRIVNALGGQPGIADVERWRSVIAREVEGYLRDAM